LCTVTARSAERDVLDALRVRWIRPSAFDYTLASAFSGANGRTILSFNHRSGRSRFVGVGEALDAYRVDLFVPSTERVFNPAVNAYEEKKGGMAVLSDAAGSRMRLRMGVPLEEDGWTACVVSLDDGAEWRVKRGETIRVESTAVRVADIGPKEMRLRPESGTGRILPAATQEEATELRERLAARREAERVAAAESEQRKTQMKILKALAREPLPMRSTRQRRLTGGGASASRLKSRSNAGATFSFGTDVRYPVEYEVVPRWIYHNGRHIYSPIVVPTRFATRRTGMRLHGTGVNVLPAPY
jgi:hypothetical protein